MKRNGGDVDRTKGEVIKSGYTDVRGDLTRGTEGRLKKDKVLLQKFCF